MTIDLSLRNATLYEGCTIVESAGLLNLTTPVAQAVPIVARNADRLVGELTPKMRHGVTLTGPAPTWSYLVVFHAVVHRFCTVHYDDGLSGPVLIAAHEESWRQRPAQL